MPAGWGSGSWGGSPWGGGTPPLGPAPPAPPGSPDNLSFEIPDGSGGARSWTTTAIDTWSELAAYVNGGVPFGWEGFEGAWSNNELFLFTFPAQPIGARQAIYSLAFFAGGQPFESFEVWVFPYLRTANYQAAIYVGAHTYDNFDLNLDEWHVPPFYVSWDVVPFAPGIADTFEAGWGNRTGVPFYDLPSYDGAFLNVKETFESVKADAGATVDLTGLWTQANHGLIFNCRVSFVPADGGTLPGGIVAGVLYYVISPTANTFEVSMTSGGSAVVPSTVGVGLTTLVDTTDFWDEIVAI